MATIEDLQSLLQVAGRAKEVGAALWAALPINGHADTGRLLALSVAAKDNVRLFPH